MAQLAAHTLGLVPAAATIAIGQRLALERQTQLERWFIPVTIVSMSVAFLVGAYVLRPPFDFLLGYAAVGAVLELASRTIDRQHIREAVIQAAATKRFVHWRGLHRHVGAKPGREGFGTPSG
jgi:hypothetical protein